MTSPQVLSKYTPFTGGRIRPRKKSKGDALIVKVDLVFVIRTPVPPSRGGPVPLPYRFPMLRFRDLFRPSSIMGEGPRFPQPARENVGKLVPGRGYLLLSYSCSLSSGGFRVLRRTCHGTEGSQASIR